MKTSFLLPVLLLIGATVSAHELQIAGPQNPAELLRTWTFDPGVVIPMVASAVLYGIGVFRLRQASPRSVHRSDTIYFALGWCALVFALVSPVHAWGSVLFSAHMTQHELLMLVAAPLLVLGRPIVPFLWALPRSWARTFGRLSKIKIWQKTWRSVSNPFVAWLIHAIVLWAWHAPFLFQATLESEPIHALQHASFLFSALLFWWAVIHGRQRALGFGLAVLYMFTTALHSGLLGALLTFANSIWYPIYAERTVAWGLTPLEDQQIGGLIMWIPAGLVYIAAGLALFAGWLRESGARARSLTTRTDFMKVSCVLICLAVIALSACSDRATELPRVLTNSNPERGKVALIKYGCTACHTIPGVAGSNALTAPPLIGISQRSYFAGMVENTPENLRRWIQHPRQINPHTAMPEQGVTDQDASDIAAYLYTTR
jgi:cytochrome c oxidase assembly factor CtaG/cytochrome c2